MNDRSFDDLWIIWQERLTALSGKELQVQRRLGAPGAFIAVALGLFALAGLKICMMGVR